MRRLGWLVLLLPLLPVGVAAQPAECDGNFHVVHDVSDGALNSVDFAPGGAGWAVGFDYASDGSRVSALSHGPQERPWIVRFDDGSFEEIHPPHEVGTELNGVSALSDTDVWAVGEFLPTYGRSKAIAYHWDGATWTQMTASRVGRFAQLNDVVAISPSDVWAVGFYSPPGEDSGNETLLVHYDGSSWSRVPAPAPGRFPILNAIDGTASDAVWAVGKGARARPLVLRWDGTEWERRLGKLDFDGRQEALAVDTVTEGDIWIAGSGSRKQDLLLHRTGRDWSLHDFPDTRGFERFTGVAATATEAWVVGDRFVYTPYETSIPLAGYWDGDSWQRSSFEGDRFGHINDVALDEVGDAWAVGETFHPETEGGLSEVIERACT